MAVPTTKFKVSQIWVLTLILRDVIRNKSSSERYNIEIATILPGGSGTVASQAQATTAAGKIIGYRRANLPLEVRIDYARLTRSVAKTAAYKLNSGAYAPIAQTGEDPIGSTDASGTSLVFRLESPSGLHATRQNAFLKDGLVTGSILTGVDLAGYDPTSPPAIAGDGTGQASAQVAWRAWMSVMQQLTFRASKDGAGFMVEPWGKCTFLRVSSKKLGKYIAV